MSSKDIVLNFFEKAYNNKEVSYIYEIYANNYYEHRIDGARSSKDCYNILKGAIDIFPDIHIIVNDIVEENDIIAVRITVSATHKADFFGIPATNKKITFEAMEFFRISNKKITESWGNWPIYDILSQLKI